MPTNTYDAIVLGTDLAGLIAGALCARSGLRVLVAETPQAPPDKLTVGPYQLPRVPAPFVGESSLAVRRVIGELNFIQTMKRRLSPLRPTFAAVLPDARVELSTDEAFLRELDRELPGDRAPVEKWLARAAEISEKGFEKAFEQGTTLPPEGFWQRREIERYEAVLPAAAEDVLAGASPRARALLALPAAFTLPADPRAQSPVAILRAFDLWRRGVSRLDGGRDALRALLIDKLRTQHAGEIRTVTPASLSTKWSHVSGLTVRERDETLGMQQLICALPIAELGDLFGERRPKKLAGLERSITPTAYRYVLNLVVREAGIPEGMPPVTFFVADPSKPLVGDNALAIHLSEPDDDARVIVTVVANADAPGDGQTLDDVLAALRPKLRARLDEIMPFSSEHVVLVHSPNQERPPEGKDAGKDARIPLCPPEPLWSWTLPSFLGVSAIPYDAAMKGVTFASTQVLPGLGLEGDFAVAWYAAQIIRRATGKKRDFLKDDVLLSGT